MAGLAPVPTRFSTNDSRPDGGGRAERSLITRTRQVEHRALPPQTLKKARESVEREMVQDALRRHRGKITSAALELGVSRPTLYELMEKLGIARDS